MDIVHTLSLFVLAVLMHTLLDLFDLQWDDSGVRAIVTDDRLDLREARSVQIVDIEDLLDLQDLRSEEHVFGRIVGDPLPEHVRDSTADHVSAHDGNVVDARM